jgi:hypothetical protein
LGAFFWTRSARPKKPGFPLQVLGFAYANPAGFPLQSLAPRNKRLTQVHKKQHTLKKITTKSKKSKNS